MRIKDENMLDNSESVSQKMDEWTNINKASPKFQQTNEVHLRGNNNVDYFGVTNDISNTKFASFVTINDI